MTHNQAIFRAALAAIIWGITSAPLAKYLDTSPFLVASFRLLTPCLVALLILLYQRQHIIAVFNKITCLASFLNLIRLVLYFIALSFFEVGKTVVVSYCFPLFAVIFARYIYKEKISRIQMLALSLGLFGVVIIYYQALQEIRDLLAVNLLLASSLIYAFSTNLVREELKKFTPLQTCFIQNLCGALLAPFVMFYFGERIDTKLLYLGSFYGLITGFIGFILFYKALAKLKMVETMTLSYLEVPVTVIMGILIFNEKLEISTLIGGLLILVSGLLIAYFKNKEKNSFNSNKLAQY